MKTNFYLNARVNKDGKNSILCFVRENNIKVNISTNLTIEKSKWNQTRQRVKHSYSESTLLNRQIDKLQETINTILLTERQTNINFSVYDLKRVIETNYKPKSVTLPKQQSFWELYNDFMEIRKSVISESSTKKFISLRNHLKNFEAATKFKIDINKFDLYFFDKFNHYLTITKQQNANTVSKYFDLIKTFLNWTFERNLHNTTDFRKFKTKEYEKRIIALSSLELYKLENLELQGTLQKVKDVFLFACYTGARFSDCVNFRFSDIRQSDGNYYWYLQVTKTSEILTIPLINKALEIITKYIDADKNSFDVISSQKTNKALKEICKIADVSQPITITEFKANQRTETEKPKYELITFHVARKTFVTLSLEKGIRAETLMQISGHKNFKTMKKYISVTQKLKAVELGNAWNNTDVLTNQKVI